MSDDFFDKCISAGNGGFKKALNTFLEGIGLEFLKVIQDEIKRKKIVDTRLLLGSFHKGHEKGVWEHSEGGLTLVVGTNVEYAKYVNDGHWTCEKGEAMRFVPGDVTTDASGKVISFEYNKSAKTGIMLKQRYIEGRHYWEDGIKFIEKMLPGFLEKEVQKWLDSYFG